MRLGLLGGTFDPIHCGHLDAARVARDRLALDRVLFIPSHVPPHRTRSPQVSGYHRFAMTALAILGEEGFEASDIELQRSGASFSIDTVRELRGQGWTPSQLFFITGADAFAEVHTWRESEALLDETHFVVVTRPGHALASLLARMPELAPRIVNVDDPECATGLDARPPAIILIDARTADVSSTDIRQRLTARAPLTGLVPASVERHIRQHQLYGSPPGALRLHGQD